MSQLAGDVFPTCVGVFLKTDRCNGPLLNPPLRLIRIEKEQVVAEFQSRDVLGGACSAVATDVDADEISICVEDWSAG